MKFIIYSFQVSKHIMLRKHTIIKEFFALFTIQHNYIKKRNISYYECEYTGSKKIDLVFICLNLPCEEIKQKPKKIF